LLSIECILPNLFLVGIDLLQFTSQLANDSQNLLLDISVQGLLDSISEVTGDLADDAHVYITVSIVLVELINKDSAHALFNFCASPVHCVEVNLKLEFKEKDLFLLANGYRGATFKGFNLIEPDKSLLLSTLNLNLSEVLS